jgi:glycosyltransferase involved in cell wall biosynthesis
VRAEAVDVIPLAPAPGFAGDGAPGEDDRIRRTYVGSNAPYILFVGKLSGRHAIPALVAAFAEARAGAASAHVLVLVGPNVLGLDVATLGRRAGLDERTLVHVPHVSEEDLPAVYRAADLFVFPASDAEGFGLPILEAMACGTPVLSTAQGSVPEVAGDAAWLVPDTSVRALSFGLAQLLSGPDRRRDLRARGLARAAQFSWRRTAEETMNSLWRAATSGATMGATWTRRA